MANNEGSENNMEFFFTLDATPELQNTHTIFGKVTGETVFNMLKLSESQTDANERPLYPHKIIKVKILHNPFEDLEPRVDHKKSSKDDEGARKSKREGVKNFKLISFGDEAEQDEQEVESFPKEKTLEAPAASSSSSVPAKKEKKETVKKVSRGASPQTPPPKSSAQKPDEDSDSDYEATVEKEKLAELEKKRKEIQDQIKDIKKQYQKDRKEKTQEKVEEAAAKPTHEDEAVRDYLDEKEKYKKKKLGTKGSSREAFTLSLLTRFKDKLHTALETTGENPPKNDADDDDDENWLSHKLDFSESQDAVLAKDASKKQDDWYDIYDPRNPLNKRKRAAEGTSGEARKSKKFE